MSALDAYDDLAGLERRIAEGLSRLGGAERSTFGTSVEGRPLWAVRAGRVDGPAILLVGGIHGNELFGPRLAAAFLHRLAEDGTDLLRRAQVWIVPVANPDGYARTVARDGRGPVAALRTNARGVDLNRNFPLPDGAVRPPWPGAGSDRPGAATYRGPAPLSEPESRALADLARRIGPKVAASLHTFMGTLIPAYTPFVADHRAYRALCAAFRRAQPRRRYLRLASRHLDGPTGELEDFLHHHIGAFAVCVESFPVLDSLRATPWPTSPGRRFLPADPAPWIANDTPGLLAYFRAGLDRIERGEAPRRMGAG